LTKSAGASIVQYEAKMRKALPFSMAFMFLVSAAAAQNWTHGTFDEALAKAQSEKKLVLVDFYSGG
jgi:hypothetical protein